MSFAETFQDDQVTRALPHAVGPEKSVISTCLQDPQEYIGLAIEFGITEDHFYLPSNRIVFGRILDLFGKGIEIEIVSLVQGLLDDGLLDRAGGPSAVAGLYTYAPSPVSFAYHLKLIRDKHILRSLIDVSSRTIAAAYDAPGEAAEALDEAERSIMAIRDGADAADAPKTIKQAVSGVITELHEMLQGETTVAGVTTGFAELDRKTSGMKPGDMFVIAARPSMGKTALMMNIVEHVCLELSKACLVFSAEMSTHQLTRRLVFSRARYASGEINRGVKPDKGTLQRIQRVALDVAAAKLHIDDTPNISINQIRAKARRKKRDAGIEFIAIDYLQLLKSRSKQAENSREREISEISSGIKILAKELGIPILILAQLNRGPESRAGKNVGVPRMSDLRESGSIEQDADMVGLLYRKAYYAESDDEKAATAGWAQLELAKNRSGETGSIPLTFVADLMRFESGHPQQEEMNFRGGKDRFGN